MSLKKNILFIIFIISNHLLYCQVSNKLRIDLDRSYGGNFSDYLYNMEFIPLETTKQSLFGNISKLTITDSSYIILDDDTKSVLFFSPLGKFIKKINKNGNLRTSTFVFDEVKKNVIIIFENNNKSHFEIHNYNSIGDHLEQVYDDNINFEELHNKIVFNENIYWIKNITSNSKTVPSFYYTQYNSSKETTSAIPLDSLTSYGIYRLTKDLGYSKPPKIFDSTFFYSTPLQHKLYKVNAANGKATLLYQLILPAKFGINDSLIQINDEKTMDQTLSKSWFRDKSVLGFENIYIDNNKIIFRAIRGVSSSYGSDGALIARNFMYKKNHLVSFEKISPDASTYFLPFYNAHTIAREGFYFYNDYLYTYISSLEVFSSYENTKNKNSKYPPTLQEYLKTQNRKSNPVIVRMKLKD